MRAAIRAALSLAMLLFVGIALAQPALYDAAKVKDYYSDWLTSIPGVSKVEVGMGTKGRAAIFVHITAPLAQRLPAELNGVPVKVVPDTDEAKEAMGPGKPYESMSEPFAPAEPQAGYIVPSPEAAPSPVPPPLIH